MNLEDLEFFPQKFKKQEYQEIQTNQKVDTPEKKTIHFKMSKDLFKILNDEKIKYLLLVIALIFFDKKNY